MRGTAPWAISAFAAVVTTACSGDVAQGPTAQVLDSAGVRIVTYDLTDLTVPTYRVIVEHDLEIGVQDGAPEYSFSRIPGLAVTRDGSFVVSDALAQELRVYDATGTYVRTIGQRGEGPGEFASAPAIVGLAGDTVFVFDRRSRRVTSFLMSGDLIEMTTLRSDDIGRRWGHMGRVDGIRRVRRVRLARVQPRGRASRHGPHPTRYAAARGPR